MTYGDITSFLVLPAKTNFLLFVFYAFPWTMPPGRIRFMLRQVVLASLALLAQLGIALIDLPTINLANAADIPPTLGWFQIPGTQLENVCPPDDFGGSGYPFAGNCAAVTEAWNSAVMDTIRNRLIIWGGGHSDYQGNELYTLSLDSLSIQRITDPGLPLAGSECSEAIAGGTQPNSRHTYDGIAYIANVDRMFVFGGSLTSCGFMSRGTWTFNFSTSTWQNMNPSGPIPNADPGVVTAYDPNTAKVFLHDSSYLYAYTFGTNSYQRLSGSNPIDYHSSAVIDPKRKKFVIVGSGSVYIYDISAGSSYAKQTLNTSGGGTIVNSDYPGLAYDPISDRIVGWNGGNTVYSLNLDMGTWTAASYSGGPGTALPNGTYDRWSYSPVSGVFVVVNSISNNAYTLRLTTGTPDRTPPAAPTGLRLQY